jgi:ankyrin repeat protein
MILRAGASVDCVGMYSWTPLLVATRGNYVDIVSMILNHSPNNNAFDADGMSALAIACKEGYKEIAKKLLKAGAYANVQDKAGNTNHLIHGAKSLPQVKGPREGKMKKKNNHSFYLPHGGNNGDNEQEKKKKKKERVDFVLTLEQQLLSGTHFSRKRPHSL